MGCNNDKYEPPKESKINEYIKTKKKIINNHIGKGGVPNSEEIQMVSKMDIDIFEFLDRNIKLYEKRVERSMKRNIKKKNEKKLEYYKKKKEEYERMKWQWEELLGEHEEIKKMEKEKEEIKERNIKENKVRIGIFAKKEDEEEEEKEEEEEELESKDYYCNGPFYEDVKNKKNKENKFDSFIKSEKNEEDYIKEKFPFVVD